MSSERGQTGAEGERGERGEEGERGRRGRTGRGSTVLPKMRQRQVIVPILVAFLILGVSYRTLFEARDGSVESCERVNALRVEFNERAGSLRLITRVLIAARQGADQIPRSAPNANAREVKSLQQTREGFSTVSLTDCKAVFPKPWPF